METKHRIIFEDARNMSALTDKSVDLVVTSPPYPMIEMWDACFGAADKKIEKALSDSDGNTAFELMHRTLDQTWSEIKRILKYGGIACINIGDAVRTLNGSFKLYPNHARIISTCLSLDLSQLPSIIWRKPTNSPNKFMGSGMLPPGAYVTLEHEHILIFRKADKREFSQESHKRTRRESAYFWEERNQWFSDVWFDLVGSRQKINTKASRNRSAAFPVELPFRLINMFSVKGDTVVDPFMGTGTTMIAAMCAARNCIGYEMDKAFQSVILNEVSHAPDIANALVNKRLEAHTAFVDKRLRSHGPLKHQNQHYGFPVMTGQEQGLIIDGISTIQYLSNDRFKVGHTPSLGRPADALGIPPKNDGLGDPVPLKGAKGRQMKLF